MRNQKGITLIALVITIIVLLILAGVSLNLVLGNEGILGRATSSVDKTEKARIKEEIEMGILDIQAKEIPKGNAVTLETLGNGQLEEYFGDITAEIENGEIVGEYKDYEYTIDDKLQVVIEGKVSGIIFKYETNPKEYTNGNVKLKLSVTSTDGEITNIEAPSNLTKNEDETYTITENGDYEFSVTDSTGKTKKKTIKISNIDKIGPIVNLSTGKVTTDSIELIVASNDEISGLAKNETYQYYLEDTLKETSTTNNYIFTELTGGTSYNLKVIVTDEAGNSTEESIVAKTAKSIAELKAGETVNYIDKNGDTIKCRVLYDTSAGYGVQIISENTVSGSTVKIGNGTGSTNDNADSSLFDLGRASYNNAIETLNAKANEYLNVTYASNARCVGTIPDNPTSEGGYHTSGQSWYVNYNGTLKNTDTNYLTDWNQMVSLGISSINQDYWLASREIGDLGNQFNYGIRYYVAYSDRLISSVMCKVDTKRGFSSEHWREIRPVFTLKSEVKVTEGDGTSDDPYILGI